MLCFQKGCACPEVRGDVFSERCKEIVATIVLGGRNGEEIGFNGGSSVQSLPCSSGPSQLHSSSFYKRNHSCKLMHARLACERGRSGPRDWLSFPAAPYGISPSPHVLAQPDSSKGPRAQLTQSLVSCVEHLSFPHWVVASCGDHHQETLLIP